jgi:hypothetical protein
MIVSIVGLALSRMRNYRRERESEANRRPGGLFGRFVQHREMRQIQHQTKPGKLVADRLHESTASPVGPAGNFSRMERDRRFRALHS